MIESEEPGNEASHTQMSPMEENPGLKSMVAEQYDEEAGREEQSLSTFDLQ